MTISLKKLIGFAKRYHALGWAVQDQIDDLISGEIDDLNLEAVKAMRTLSGVNEEFDQMIVDAINELEQKQEQE